MLHLNHAKLLDVLASLSVRHALLVHGLCFGVSTQLQSSSLVAHENSTFRNLALVVSGPFMA